MWRWAREHAHITLLASLVVACVLVWYVVLQERGKMLTVSFLDIGQGDAILIETPSGTQMLVDGGRNRAILRALSDVLPWYDRTIDVVIATHPDADHIGGLVDVLERYRVGTVVESGVVDDGSDERAFEKAAQKENVPRHRAERGEMINLGDRVYFEILSPDRPVPHLETNTGSIVGRLVYGNTAFMLTGDAPQNIEEYLVALGTDHLTAQVLKAGHHGSRTSSSPLFVGSVNPAYAVFSRGCKNTYGHPHPEVVTLFKQFETQIFDTCTDGTITFLSDGQSVRLR